MGETKTIIVTNRSTGARFSDVYTPHRENIGDLEDLCVDAGLDKQLTRCDIEGLVKGISDDETWYMLDECGNWAYLPSYYKVEVIR